MNQNKFTNQQKVHTVQANGWDFHCCRNKQKCDYLYRFIIDSELAISVPNPMNETTSLLQFTVVCQFIMFNKQLTPLLITLQFVEEFASIKKSVFR